MSRIPWVDNLIILDPQPFPWRFIVFKPLCERERSVLIHVNSEPHRRQKITTLSTIWSNGMANHGKMNRWWEHLRSHQFLEGFPTMFACRLKSYKVENFKRGPPNPGFPAFNLSLSQLPPGRGRYLQRGLPRKNNNTSRVTTANSIRIQGCGEDLVFRPSVLRIPHSVSFMDTHWHAQWCTWYCLGIRSSLIWVPANVLAPACLRET